MGGTCLAGGAALFAWNSWEILFSLTQTGRGLPLGNFFGFVAGLGGLGASLDLLGPPRAPDAAKKDIAKVHGAAQPASEWEAQAAARGDTKSAPMHDQTFPD